MAKEPHFERGLAERNEQCPCGIRAPRPAFWAGRTTCGGRTIFADTAGRTGAFMISLPDWRLAAHRR
jgi:hypothetical protein